MSLSRRGLIGAFLAAPALIRAPGLLMPIKPLPFDFTEVICTQTIDWGYVSRTYVRQLGESIAQSRAVLTVNVMTELYGKYGL